LCFNTERIGSRSSIGRPILPESVPWMKSPPVLALRPMQLPRNLENFSAMALCPFLGFID
jgi:hypothetical protein